VNGASKRTASVEISDRDGAIAGSRMSRTRHASPRLVLSVLLCAGVAAGASAPVGGHTDGGAIGAGNYLCLVDPSVKGPPATR
jgi:hypothetical protein